MSHRHRTPSFKRSLSVASCLALSAVILSACGGGGGGGGGGGAGGGNPTSNADIVEDIQGNADRTPVSSSTLNAYIASNVAYSDVDYSAALQAGSYANRNAPTSSEVKTVVEDYNAYLVSIDAVLVAMYSDSNGDGIGDGTLNASSLNAIAGVSGAVNSHGAAYSDEINYAIYAPALLAELSPASGYIAVPTAEQIQTFVEQANLSIQTEFVHSYMFYYYLWDDDIQPVYDYSQYEHAGVFLESVRDAKDKWSFLTTTAAYDAYFNQGTYYGVGFAMAYDADEDLMVSLVYPDSPADDAGMVRGDKIIAINGEAVTGAEFFDSHPDIMGDNAEGVAVTLKLMRQDGSQYMANTSKTEVATSTVFNTRIVESPQGKKAAYFMFSSFIEPSKEELQLAFVNISAFLADDQLDAVVVDLRRNGGGRVDVAVQLASQLRQSTEDEVFVEYSYNDYVQDTYFNGEGEKQNFSGESSIIPEGVKYYFLTSGDTASASEMVINGLKPYSDAVYVIGETTHGKPVGMAPVTFFDDLLILSAVSFEGVNADGEGGYFDGIAADCEAEIVYDYDFGDTRDPLLSGALMHLDTGACAAPSEVAVDVLTNGQRRSYGYTASKPTKGAIPYEGIFTEIRAF